MTLEEIQKRNYNATRKRGQITDETKDIDFCYKIREELKELVDSETLENEAEELADIALVCFAYAEHFNIDLLSEMEKKTIKNENRTD